MCTAGIKTKPENVPFFAKITIHNYGLFVSWRDKKLWDGTVCGEQESLSKLFDGCRQNNKQFLAQCSLHDKKASSVHSPAWTETGLCLHIDPRSNITRGKSLLESWGTTFLPD